MVNDSEHWRWNVNPTWHHYSFMYQEAFLADRVANDFEKYHHLSACLYFGIGALEAFLNECMRRKLADERKNEEDIFQILRGTPLQSRKTSVKAKIRDWPREICNAEVKIPDGLDELLTFYNEIRGEVTHPKRRDHSLYQEIDGVIPERLVDAVSHYIVSIYEGMQKPFQYWLLGWNFVGFNHDETYPLLSDNAQFRHSLRNMGFEVPAWDYDQALEWEQENMTTLGGFIKLKANLQCYAPDIELRNPPPFDRKPRLCRRWWDKDLIRSNP